MKRLLLLLMFISFFFILNVNTLNTHQNTNEKEMKKLIEDIIKTPARMIEIMNENKAIDCSEIVKEFKDVEWSLIDFTLSIAYIRCKGFKFWNLEKHQGTNSSEYYYNLYYEINGGKNREDFIRFNFQFEDGKLIFNGIINSID